MSTPKGLYTSSPLFDKRHDDSRTGKHWGHVFLARVNTSKFGRSVALSDFCSTTIAVVGFTENEGTGSQIQTILQLLALLVERVRAPSSGVGRRAPQSTIYRHKLHRATGSGAKPYVDLRHRIFAGAVKEAPDREVHRTATRLRLSLVWLVTVRVRVFAHTLDRHFEVDYSVTKRLPRAKRHVLSDISR